MAGWVDEQVEVRVGLILSSSSLNGIDPALQLVGTVTFPTSSQATMWMSRWWSSKVGIAVPSEPL